MFDRVAWKLSPVEIAPANYSLNLTRTRRTVRFES
jgi:hypothetical protein